MGVKENLIGQTFNKLTVIEEIPKEQRKNKKLVEWLCQCECGAYTTVRTNYLKSGHTKSCGCSRAEVAAQLFTKNIVNQRFGKLSKNHLLMQKMCQKFGNRQER